MQFTRAHATGAALVVGTVILGGSLAATSASDNPNPSQEKIEQQIEQGKREARANSKVVEFDGTEPRPSEVEYMDKSPDIGKVDEIGALKSRTLEILDKEESIGTLLIPEGETERTLSSEEVNEIAAKVLEETRAPSEREAAITDWVDAYEGARYLPDLNTYSAAKMVVEEWINVSIDDIEATVVFNPDPPA